MGVTIFPRQFLVPCPCVVPKQNILSGLPTDVLSLRFFDLCLRADLFQTVRLLPLAAVFLWGPRAPITVVITDSAQPAVVLVMLRVSFIRQLLIRLSAWTISSFPQANPTLQPAIA